MAHSTEHMDVSSDEDTEQVDVSGDEDTEQVYFQQMSSFNESLDQSIDSLPGSLALPTFTVGQSTELQVSQGFHVFTGGNLTPQRSNNLIAQKVIPGTTGDDSESGAIGPYFHPDHMTTGVSLRGNALIFQGNRIGALNLIKNTNRFQFVMQNDMHEAVTSQLIGSDVSKYDSNEADSVNEIFEDCSSDEKSGKCKTSPKHCGRKSRSTSSIENEMVSRSMLSTGNEMVIC